MKEVLHMYLLVMGAADVASVNCKTQTLRSIGRCHIWTWWYMVQLGSADSDQRVLAVESQGAVIMSNRSNDHRVITPCVK